MRVNKKDKKEMRFILAGLFLIALFGAFLVSVSNSQNNKRLARVNAQIASYERLSPEEAKQFTLEQMRRDQEYYLRNKWW